MGDLRDQLKKANLLSKKDARRLAHEDRVRRKELGGAAEVEKERARHTAELQRKRDAQREADRAAQAAVQAEKDAAAERAAGAELLRTQVRRPGRRSAGRWYFELADGRVPFLELLPADRLQVAAGALCVVRIGPAGSHAYGLIRADHARRIAAVCPGRVAYAAPAAGIDG